MVDELTDAPQPRMVLCKLGRPIPRGEVIRGVRASIVHCPFADHSHRFKLADQIPNLGMAELNESNPYKPTNQATAESHPPHKVLPKLRRGISTLAAIVWNLPFIVLAYLRFRGEIDEKTMDWLLPTWALILPIGALLVAHSAFVQRLLLVPGSDVQNNRVRLWAFAGFWTLLLTFWYTSLLFKSENTLEKLRNGKTLHEQSIAPKSRIGRH